MAPSQGMPAAIRRGRESPLEPLLDTLILVPVRDLTFSIFSPGPLDRMVAGFLKGRAQESEAGAAVSFMARSYATIPQQIIQVRGLLAVQLPGGGVFW